MAAPGGASIKRFRHPDSATAVFTLAGTHPSLSRQAHPPLRLKWRSPSLALGQNRTEVFHSVRRARRHCSSIAC